MRRSRPASPWTSSCTRASSTTSSGPTSCVMRGGGRRSSSGATSLAWGSPDLAHGIGGVFWWTLIDRTLILFQFYRCIQAVFPLPTRVEQAYMEIKYRVVHGAYPPGSPLSESKLSRTLRISRTPVREALTRLLEEGYVERVRGRGF